MRRTPTTAVPADEQMLACLHSPACPTAESEEREAAVPVASHPEQGWSLLCNGVLLFDDTGELLPNGTIVAPHRPQMAMA
ncbi:DUF5999 family protein [Streptomyces sp. BH097]|uniref:DUF5999 family protein n=1 Tax=unclassified Streptomyces TaxID=2593676 RepID=UPI003BB6D7DD